MKSKLAYLNGILTIIAIALTIIILQNAELIPKAKAGMPYTSLPLNEKGELPVRMMNNTMDVNIQSCSSYAFLNAEPIEVTMAGPIEIKTKN